MSSYDRSSGDHVRRDVDSVPASFVAPTHQCRTNPETIRQRSNQICGHRHCATPPLPTSARTPSILTEDAAIQSFTTGTHRNKSHSFKVFHEECVAIAGNIALECQPPARTLASTTQMRYPEYLGREQECYTTSSRPPMRLQLKHWPLVVLLPVLVAPFAIFGGFHKKTTDFSQCKQRFKDSEALHTRYNWTGPVEHLPPGVPRGFLVTLQGCKDVCGQWPDFYEFSVWSSAVTTWVLPLFGLILQAPFFSHEFIDTVRKYGQLVDMDGFWAMRDSIFLLSVINQYNINKNRLFTQEGATELLMRKALFLPALKNVRAEMAERIRRDGRQSVVPLFISLLWFAISISLSIFQAFGDLGANATAHNLAMGLLMAWLPVFATASIVDRNPSDADYVRDQINDLFKAVERAQTEEVASAIRTLNETATCVSTFQREWVKRVIKLAEKPQTEEVRKKLVEVLNESVALFASQDEEIPTAWAESLRILSGWVSRSTTGPEVLQEFCGQGRYPWYLGVTHPILRHITKRHLPKGRGWMTNYEWTSAEFVKDEKQGSFSVSFYSLPLPILTGVAVVTASFFGAYWISYNEPTVGLGCRSLGYVIFATIALALFCMEYLVPPSLLLNRRIKKTLLTTISILECFNFTWLLFIVTAQTTGLYNTCLCKSSIFGRHGGYMDFETIEYYKEFGIFTTWTIGTVIGVTVPGSVLLFVIYQWCSQSHLRTVDRAKATNGLRRVRIWKRWRLRRTLVGRIWSWLDESTDITVELSEKDNCFMTEIDHLVLEIIVNDQSVDKVNLVSRESEPGNWDAGRKLILRETSTEFTISVALELGENDHLPVGSIELSGPLLYDVLGKSSEIPLMAHENYPEMVLKTKIRGMSMEDFQQLFSFLPRNQIPSGVGGLNHEALAAMREFEHYGDLERLEQAISKLRIATETAAVDDPKRADVINHLGISLKYRFERLGNRADIDESVAKQEFAASLVPDSNREKPGFLSNLGSSLLTRFKSTGSLQDIHSSISNLQAAVDLAYDHPSRPGCLTNLGNSFRARFETLGNLADIDGAITAHREAVRLTPDQNPEKPTRQNNLANALMTRFDRFGDVADMDASIENHQAAVRLRPDGHPYKPGHLSNLGSCYVKRFRRLGDVSDLNEGIKYTRLAIDLMPDDHPHKSYFLNNLGSCMISMFRETGNKSDIDDAVKYHQAAVGSLPDGHPEKPRFLHSLRDSLSTRFEFFGDLADLDGAIVQIQATVNSTPDGHPEKPSFLDALGNTFMARFDRFGRVADIDEAIAQLQKAADLTPDGHPDKVRHLTNLGTALQTRFKRLGTLNDIDDALEKQQSAVNLMPDDHPLKPRYKNNLGNAFINRFERLQNPSDIDKGISQHKEGLDLVPESHPDRSLHENNMASAFLKRFEYLKIPEDINNAIEHQRKSIELTPDSNPEKSARLSNLGLCLLTRFHQFGNFTDLDDGISRHREALDLTVEGHPDRCRQLSNLGAALITRFTRRFRREDADEAITHLSAAATSSSAPPTTRYKAVKRWIQFSSTINHSSVLNAYECVLGLMPLVAWLGLPIADRHQHLMEMGEFTRDAAAAAIIFEKYDTALEWLEQGRSIVWTQILQLRTPVDRLREVNPKLAARLLQVSRLLDHGFEEKQSSEEKKTSKEEEGRKYRSLTTEWEEIVEQVRSLPSFEDFLRPPKLSRLVGTALNGPVVVLNIAKWRCDALAILPGLDDIIHIPLPNVTSDTVLRLRDELKDVLYSGGLRLRAERAAKKESDESDHDTCGQILGDLWKDLVFPIVNFLALHPHPETLPHIRWCATGPLAFLPIHAAGIYDEGSSNTQLSDYAISSYTPTLSALLDPPDTTVRSSFRLLSVIEPSAPGASYIPNTEEELERIIDRLQDRDLTVLAGPEATKERVVQEMKSCHWIHLACHGVQNPIEPTKSALLIHDGHLTLEEIIKLDLPNAEFAFLSACQTTTGDEKLSEEAVHIAGGMLLAGYRSVVATMWSIQDELAPEVADEFYAHIMKENERPDSRKAAEALHISVKRLRKEYKLPLTAWIPFVHLGI
ncbi:hypothetical protein CPB86DRAFT_873630 [Serendipita vermifera]|nr:hypothetical protein CPB86DRAFT_873630 [Serendipita vermifera]